MTYTTVGSALRVIRTVFKTMERGVEGRKCCDCIEKRETNKSVHC